MNRREFESEFDQFTRNIEAGVCPRIDSNRSQCTEESCSALDEQED